MRDEALSATDRLAGYLEDKTLLIILDNCGHLADACAALAGKLLARGAGVRVLATSRHRLGAEGEQLLPVEPFGVSDDAGVSQEALTLFADRARAVAPGFDVDHGSGVSGCAGPSYLPGRPRVRFGRCGVRQMGRWPTGQGWAGTRH